MQSSADSFALDSLVSEKDHLENWELIVKERGNAVFLSKIFSSSECTRKI